MKRARGAGISSASGFWQTLLPERARSAGKITILSLCAGSVAVLASTLMFEARIPTVSADDVTTSVTVLNTAPTWTIDAEESAESSATTPTNAGQVISWVATANDSNAEQYYLLICKTNGAPTGVSSGPPQCNGGVANQWAVSGATASDAQATAATTTKATTPFHNESNDWYAFICDANGTLAQCNATPKQGTGNTASPFVVNHPPVFALIANDSPVDPDDVITWTATAYDTDVIRGGDTVQLIVCKSQDFTGTVCGAGGTWATSTFAASNPATSTTMRAPAQDGTYNAYVYVTDNFYLAATSTHQASNSSFVVNNVAPTVDASTVTLYDPNDGTNTVLDLFRAHSTSGPFQVRQFQVTDGNGCQNSVGGPEFTLATTSIYRSGVTQASCSTSSHFNTNSCYPSSNSMTRVTCTQDAGSCSGASDSAATWTCVFHLWYNADATVASTQYPAQDWRASVQVQDDDGALSAFTEGTSGYEVSTFLAFDVSSTSIAYGGLQPTEKNDPLSQTTDMIAYGNVGLNQSLYGDTMCTNWTAPDSCDAGGIDPTREIAVSNQKFATSSVDYDDPTVAFSLTSSGSPSSLDIRIQKTVATNSPQMKQTWWGIQIPGTITLAGDYEGQNTITAVTSNAAYWGP